MSKIDTDSNLGNLDTTVKGSVDNTGSDDDATLDLTEVTDLTNLTEDESSDKTVIVRTEISNHQATSISTLRNLYVGGSVITAQVIEKPHKSPGHDKIEPGVTLKNRFLLVEKLGQGGMGVVFKAKDLLKVEARDKNPYVAIKVLTEAFKKYSGSFIALQREASKAQRLAHPNIATVYDFDRDSGTVFMTMEFLQGKPLNQLIKDIVKNPLRKDHALHIIAELCSGLAYAHENMLIHSDFKPGNCMLLTDGRVKLLDFGIARASTQTVEEKEKTLFDPARLSAVTPAYATPEMFIGMNPDPRDDIYGLACVAYQLLSGGKHPYNKVAAPRVKELGIKPKPIKGLNRRQQKTLMKALTIDRQDRIPTVELFAEGMRSQKSHTSSILLVSLILVLIAGGIGYRPYLAFRAEQQLSDQILSIKQGNTTLMIETIWSLEKMSPEHQKLLSVGLRREIITYYRDRIGSVFNPAAGLYDYPKASELLARAEKHYPDSVALSSIKEQIYAQKRDLMGRLESLYQRYLDGNKLVKTASGEDLTTVLPLIRRVDPDHYISRDTRLTKMYLVQAEALISERKFGEASNYVLTGLKLYPNDQRLLSLANQIDARSSNR